MKMIVDFSITAQISSSPDKWQKLGISPQELEVADMTDLKKQCGSIVDTCIQEFITAGQKVNERIR